MCLHISISLGELIIANIKTVIIKDRKIYAGGDVSVLNIPASYVTFEVSFGIGVKNDGQVIYLRNIEGDHYFSHSFPRH